jgi:hypothetical protein
MCSERSPPPVKPFARGPQSSLALAPARLGRLGWAAYLDGEHGSQSGDRVGLALLEFLDGVPRDQRQQRVENSGALPREALGRDVVVALKHLEERLGVRFRGGVSPPVPISHLLPGPRALQHLAALVEGEVRRAQGQQLHDLVRELVGEQVAVGGEDVVCVGTCERERCERERCERERCERERSERERSEQEGRVSWGRPSACAAERMCN